MSFRNTPCWQATDAADMLKTEALETRRAAFMAVHTAISDFRVEGMQAAAVRRRDEAGLLDALVGRGHRHLFCVVQGEPGSGKSHLIRWLNFEWSARRSDDLVLMVPRSGGSLEGALRHLREGLPDDYRALFAGLGQPHETSLAGRSRDFAARLASSLTDDYFVGEPRAHAEWAAEHNLSRLLNHHGVLEKWTAPRRILETLSGGADRNSRAAEITLPDVLELTRLLRGIRDPSMGPKAMMARRKFEREALAVAPLLEGSEPRDDADVEAAGPMLHRLREALDARFSAVVADLVGVGRDALKRAFHALREQLAVDGRRLVLLLEDITSFQGVDHQLLDVLIASTETETGAGPALCDLISVVGITTDFFARTVRSYANLRERIGLHVHLGDASGGRAEDVLDLAGSRGRRRFVANYLRAIRAGMAAIERWDEQGRGPVPNRCVDCPYRAPCHRGFGATDDGVGFFPLSSHAIDRIYGALSDPHGTMSLRTPRALVQNVLSPLLLDPDRLRGGQYPPANLDTMTYLPAAEDRLVGALRQVPATLDDPEAQARMRRLLAWWSPPRASAQSRRDAEGRRLFAEIPAEVYAAFDLPWPGSDEDGIAHDPGGAPPGPRGRADAIDDTTPDAIANPAPADAIDPSPSGDRSPPEPPAAGSSASGGGADEGARTPPATSRPARAKSTRASRSRMERLRAEIHVWQSGGAVVDSDGWSKVLAEILDGLPWLTLGVPVWLRDQLFTPATIVLQGTRQTGRTHFVVPRAPWVSHGLDAWLALRTDDRSAPGESEFARRRVARFLRRLQRQVVAHVADKTLATPDGTPWDPGATAAQALLVRDWLQGRTAPDAPLAEQWQRLFQPDEGNRQPATGRVASWHEIVQRVGNYARSFQDFLREWTQLPLGKKGGLVDAGAIAPALVALARLEPGPVPVASNLGQQLGKWSAIADIGQKLRKILPALPRYETERIMGWVGKLDTACDRRTLPAYLEEVDRVVDALCEVDPDLPMVPVQQIRQALADLEQRGLRGAIGQTPALAAVDRFVEEAIDGDGPPETTDPSSVLRWVIDAPSADLERMVRRVDEIEAALDALGQHVADLLSASGDRSGDPIAELSRLGLRIEAAARRLTPSPAPDGGSA